MDTFTFCSDNSGSIFQSIFCGASLQRKYDVTPPQQLTRESGWKVIGNGYLSPMKPSWASNSRSFLTIMSG
jgi:hypothetical protein